MLERPGLQWAGAAGRVRNTDQQGPEEAGGGGEQGIKCHREAEGDKCSLNSAEWMKSAFLAADNELAVILEVKT